ncbi:unnamed protein product [Cunninghamella echinulata]
MPTVYIVFYSLYQHVYTLAQEVQKGLEKEGVDVKLFQVPETLSDEILEKMHAPPKPDVPVITVDELPKADAIIWGIPTRFGSLPSQIQSFFDATGQLWASGALSNKPTSVFFSTGSQHGGQETTAFNTIPYFAHHGLLYVPLGFANSHMFDNSEVIGSSAYGAGGIAGPDGSRQISEKEKEIAITQGSNFAKVVNALHKGKLLLEQSSVTTTDQVESTTATTSENETTDNNNNSGPSQEKKKNNNEKPKKKKFSKDLSRCLCM